MASISGAGTPIDIKLGQVPTTKNPQLAYELQGIYNSLHILSQYLEVLRAGLEGSDSQTPSENIRFLKFLNAPAKQVITAGQVVTVDVDDGLVVRGTSTGILRTGVFEDSPYPTGMIQTFFAIALTDAEIGENVRMGVGPGILKLTGAQSGQQVYAAASRGIEYRVKGVEITYYNRILSEDGNLYLANPKAQRLPGYPKDLSSTFRMLGHYVFSPVGICIADDYVLFSDFIYYAGRVVTNGAELYP